MCSCFCVPDQQGALFWERNTSIQNKKVKVLVEQCVAFVFVVCSMCSEILEPQGPNSDWWTRFRGGASAQLRFHGDPHEHEQSENTNVLQETRKEPPGCLWTDPAGLILAFCRYNNLLKAHGEAQVSSAPVALGLAALLWQNNGGGAALDQI